MKKNQPLFILLAAVYDFYGAMEKFLDNHMKPKKAEAGR
jgi:hypothetical protein